jgi:hypothetical protein
MFLITVMTELCDAIACLKHTHFANIKIHRADYIPATCFGLILLLYESGVIYFLYI